jgi:predicted PurR-regulated permease PerM
MSRRQGILGHIRRERPEAGAAPDAEWVVVDVDTHELEGVFAAPQWLRDAGALSWLLVGICVLLAAVVAILALVNTIVIPVVTAMIIAAVCSPLVRRLARRLPRAVAAAAVFVSLLLVGLAVVVLVLSGIVSQARGMQDNLRAGVEKLEEALRDAGVGADSAQRASSDASGTVSDAFHALLGGLATGIGALASLAVFLTFTALSLFFLLKDGPVIRTWTERHMGIPPAVARIVTGRTLEALQGYFIGVTAIAVFNAVLIGLGALVLDLPQVGSIMLVNFFAAYVPYLGAWSAGAFTVLIALGSQGPETAVAMGVIVLLANGALQQMIQPIAFGATLGIHPLAVLIVTIAGGSLFGTIGLILAAPLTSAVLRISADLARARALEARGTTDAPAAREDGEPVTPPAGATAPR